MDFLSSPIVVLVILVIAAFVALAYFAYQRANAKWKDLADRLGAIVVSRAGGYRMDLLERGGETIRLETFSQNDGDSYSPVTQFSTEVLLPQPIRFKITRAIGGAQVEQVVKVLGLRGVQVSPRLDLPDADPAFTSKYAVRSDQPSIATEFATLMAPYVAPLPSGEWEVVPGESVHRITATIDGRVDQPEKIEALLSVFREFRQQLGRLAKSSVAENGVLPAVTLPTVPSNIVSTGFGGAGRTGGFLFGAFFFGIGMIFLVMGGLSAIQFTRASLTWVKVPAEIVSASVKEVDGDDGPTYRPDVAYQYSWSGMSFQSKSMGVGMMSTGVSGGSGSAEAWVSTHPPGTSVTAYVDPGNPSVAALDVRLNFLALLFMLFPVPHVSIGICAMLSSILGMEGLAKLRPILVGVAFAWGLFALALTVVSGSIGWATSAILFIYLGIAWAVLRAKPRSTA